MWFVFPLTADSGAIKEPFHGVMLLKKSSYKPPLAETSAESVSGETADTGELQLCVRHPCYSSDRLSDDSVIIY
jgi:hypothetical protein